MTTAMDAARSADPLMEQMHLVNRGDIWCGTVTGSAFGASPPGKADAVALKIVCGLNQALPLAAGKIGGR